MKAYALTDFESAPMLVDIDVPEPADGEVRVRVHAASVNGFDLSVAGGNLKDMMEHRFPVALGKDFAGVVDAVGDDVDDYQVGDRVFGVVTKPYLGDGSFGEYVTVSTAVGLARLPESVDFVEGAALGLAGVAALAAVDAGGLEPGQSVLIVGATGGVGSQAVQLANHAGAHVIATASSEAERTLVTDLGAATTVDYHGDVAAAVREARPDGVDVIIHLAGDPDPLLPALRAGGRFISTRIASPDQVPAEDASVTAIWANPEPETLARIAAQQAEGRTRVHVQQTFPLDQAPAAFTAFAEGSLGKVVITTA